MLIKKPADIPSSEITPKSLHLNRRKFLAATVISGAAAVAGMVLDRCNRLHLVRVTQGPAPK